MSVRRVVAAVVLLASLLLLTASTYRSREFDRWLDEETAAPDRYVDAHVRLHVVAKDPAGIETDPTKLTKLRTHRFGGWIDTQWSPPRLMTNDGAIASAATECELGEGRDWYCSVEQEPVVLHGASCGCDWCEKPRPVVPAGKLALGGMGAGKTTAGVLWTYLRWLEHVGARWTDPEAADEAEREQPKAVEGGITAPTQTRVDIVLNELFGMFAPNWYSYRSSEGVVTMCDGTRIRAVSTYKQSASQGSALQGFNWSFWLGDEMQDQIDEYVNIQARLRSAKNGNGKRLATATAKNDPAWRTWRDALDAIDWFVHQMLGTSSPFVAAEHWEKMRRSTSPTQYKRIVLAQDLPSDLAEYPEWSRDHNLILVPDFGWTDVTENELKIYGHGRAELVGHDPGTLWDVSLGLRAYVANRDFAAYQRGLARPFWVVRAEINTEQSTTERHIAKLLEHAWSHHLNQRDSNGKPSPYSKQILVRADPAGDNDNRTDKSVYTQFTNAGIHIKPAAYNATNDGHGRVPKNAGIELVNTLFCSESGERRLFVEKLADGTIVAPKLVEAIETAERDGLGKAEAQRKGAKDMSHWRAALRYALWAIERPRLKAVEQEV